uniref:Uncharacterized protein n=1 Tax=Salix viminalis TaxID=40686 RepID=A0A6N2M5C2_SALVM
MLLLDGCFIVELICKMSTSGPQQGDPVTGNSLVLYTVSIDMMLLENQLPFCVLLKLFSMAMPESEAENTEYEFIRSAKELKEAGIRFGKQAGSYRFFQGVHFEKGMIKIPCLTVEDATESLFRNLIAYEQCSQSQHLYVTDYIILMDCLINTREDVQILRHCRIIENGLGDDEMVCKLFNKLGIHVMFPDRDRFYYAQLFQRVEKHCARRRNIWLAKLRRDYFNSPWTLISFIAAFSLLLLTLIQTVFTVMSYFK